MNIRLLTVLLIFVSLCCIVDESYACVGIPKAVIDDPDPKYQVQDVNVYFEGENSYDTDPPPEGGDSIVDYYWVWPSGSYEQDKSPDNGHLGWAKFSSTGERKVGLFVQDDEENWSTKEECTVRIVEVGLSAERGYVAVNNDDDNANEKPDYHSNEQTVTGENDLVKIYPSVNPGNDWQDCKVRLSVYGNQYCIKIWSDQNKVNQIIPDGSIYYKDYDPGSLPSELYVEGISTTPAGQTVDIALLYRVGSVEVDQVDIDLIVLEVDQDMVGVDDTSQKTEEIVPGGFIALNQDDDDDNEIADKDENGPITDEDNLVMLTLYKVSPTDLTGNVTLKAIAGGTKIKIWENQTKSGTPITLPETYATPSDLPKYLWLEGFANSTSVRDITLALEYTIGGTTFDDRIKLTVVKVDVEVAGNDNDTHEIISVKDASKVPDDHFVTAKGSGNIGLWATTVPDDIEVDDTISWTGITQHPDENLYAYMTRASSGKFDDITVNVCGRDAKDLTNWVVWATTGSTPTFSKSTQSGQVTTGDSTSGPGLNIIFTVSNLIFTISPSTIITDSDRPNLAGSHSGSVPGGAQLHIITNTPLSGGVNKKWDGSRRGRFKVLNPNLYTKNQLVMVPGTYYNNQPVAVDIPEDYPSNNLIGNDDLSTYGDDNDPYNSPNIGKLTSDDTPSNPMRHSTGSNNDTYEERYHFQEFARLELGTTWYVISGPIEWKAHFKYKRVNGEWTDDDSSAAADNSGWQ